jgi:predicted nucleic acid-binding protein
MIHLDNSFLIRAILPGSAEDRCLRDWLRAGEFTAVSAIVWAELLCGPVSDEQAQLAATVVGGPVPFLAEDGALAAHLYNLTARRRGTLIDCMIAATAIRRGAPLATSNLEDFRRFQPHGLRLAPR